jgi:shikimate dehydrogenase
MRKYGLIGFPLGHSFSKRYFAKKFADENISDCCYDNYPIEQIEFIVSLISLNPELMGLNVTIPYKQQVFNYLDEIDDEASIIGSVNTIKIDRSANKTYLKGFNTDAYGFAEPLRKVLQDHHKKAIILGTGGSSKSVAYVLRKMNIDFKYVSRNPKTINSLSYDQLTPEVLQDYTIIVNTSPLGMYPNIESCPEIPYDALTSKHILYDLVYNPEKTLFLKMGEQRKTTIINGLSMLYLQAEKSWEIWNSNPNMS